MSILAIIIWLVLFSIPALLVALLLDSLWKAWDGSQNDFWMRLFRLYRWRGLITVILFILSAMMVQVRVLVDGKPLPVPLWMSLAQASVMPGIILGFFGAASIYASLAIHRRWSWGLFVFPGTVATFVMLVGGMISLLGILPDSWHTVSHSYEGEGFAGGVSTTLAPIYMGSIFFPIGMMLLMHRARTGPK